MPFVWIATGCLIFLKSGLSYCVICHTCINMHCVYSLLGGSFKISAINVHNKKFLWGPSVVFACWPLYHYDYNLMNVVTAVNDLYISHDLYLQTRVLLTEDVSLTFYNQKVPKNLLHF